MGKCYVAVPFSLKSNSTGLLGRKGNAILFFLFLNISRKTGQFFILKFYIMIYMVIVLKWIEKNDPFARSILFSYNRSTKGWSWQLVILWFKSSLMAWIIFIISTWKQEGLLANKIVLPTDVKCLKYMVWNQIFEA